MLSNIRIVTKQQLDDFISSGYAKRIQGFVNAYITKDGYIINDKTLMVKTGSITSKGYKRVGLKRTDGRLAGVSVQKLVAQAFLEPYVLELPGSTLKFKDNNKLNVSADNLTWVSLTSTLKNKRKVLTYDKTTIYEGSVLNQTLVDGMIKSNELKLIKNSPGFYIHEYGFVVNTNDNKNTILTTFRHKDGYVRLALPSIQHTEVGRKTLKRVNFTMHLLVAQAFIEPYTYRNGIMTINHIDGNKENNYYKNLEWVSVKDNINHAHDTGLVKGNTRFEIYNLKTKKKFELRSLRELGRYLKLPLDKLVHRIIPSTQYPIYGRFIIKILNKDSIIDISKRNSTPIYIYDYTDGKTYKFISKFKAALMLGIDPKIIYNTIGYIGGRYISNKEIDINKLETVTKEKAIADRNELWNKPLYKYE